MNLDLTLFTADWQPQRDAVAARIIVTADEHEFVQLRVDLGVLQMAATGRPDGARFHGLPSALDFARHELRLGHALRAADWDELERELHQFNYRRLAYAGLADDALTRNDMPAAIDLINRTIRDIEHCLNLVLFLEQEADGGAGQHVVQIPVLIFQRARLQARALALEDRYEDAIDAAEAGIAGLEEALLQAGFDESQRAQDSGISYLRQTTARLRRQHGIGQTLAERLADAVAREDFAAAAQLRDELRRRSEPKRT